LNRESLGNCICGAPLCEDCDDYHLEMHGWAADQDEFRMDLFDRWKPDSGQREEVRALQTLGALLPLRQTGVHRPLLR
jgi:hypothetical protein